jgi:RNA polymerase sigma factor (sigma-70 family)
MSVEIPFDLASLQGFERLYRTYYGYAWAVLARLGVPSASVDDAHQDVFVTAYRRRDTFQRGRPVKPWLAGIARRVAFRYRRSQQRIDRKRAVLSHAEGSGRVAMPDLRGRLEAGEFLRAFIEELDPRLRDVFVLAELEGYTGPEIAERLAINLDTAYTRLRTARALLRRALGTVEDREAPDARVERGLVVLLPKLAAPGRLAWISALGAKAKLGLVSGVAAAGLVAAVAVARPEERTGAGSRAAAEAREGSKRAQVDVAARGRGEGAPEAAVTVAVPEVAVPELASPAADARPAAPVSRTRTEPRGAAERGALDEGTAADLQREVEQLTAAREALAAGRPADALAHLDAHARAHPSSSLAEAHAALRIASLCAVGRREQARGEASILLRSHPGSTVAQHAMTRCDDAEAEVEATALRPGAAP